MEPDTDPECYMSYTPSFDQIRAQYARNAKSLQTIVEAAQRSGKPTFRGNTIVAWQAQQARCERLSHASDEELRTVQAGLAHAFNS